MPYITGTTSTIDKKSVLLVSDFVCIINRMKMICTGIKHNK